MISWGLVGIIVLIMAFFALPWGAILTVLGIGAIILGATLAYAYKYETGMIVAMVVLFIIPGVFLFFWGMSIG